MIIIVGEVLGYRPGLNHSIAIDVLGADLESKIGRGSQVHHHIIMQTAMSEDLPDRTYPLSASRAKMAPNNS